MTDPTGPDGEPRPGRSARDAATPARADRPEGADPARPGSSPRDAATPARAAPAGRTSARSRWLRGAFLVVALAFAALALAAQWDEASDRIDDLSVGHIAAAAVFTAGSLLASFLAWRETLAGLGSRLALRPAGRVFFLGQLAKYVPGSVWAIVGQMELATVHGVRRERTATAGIVVLVISLAMGLLLGLLAVPALLDAEGGLYASAVVLLVPLGVALHPKVLTSLVQTGLRLLRRPSLDAPLTLAMIWRVAAFSLLSNGFLGLQLWQLATDVGGDGWDLVALAVGGYGIAAAVSLVVIPLPAGAGLREAILVLLLAPEIGVAGATLVAIIARLLLTVADVAAAALAAAATRTPPELVADHH